MQVHRKEVGAGVGRCGGEAEGVGGGADYLDRGDAACELALRSASCCAINVRPGRGVTGNEKAGKIERGEGRGAHLDRKSQSERGTPHMRSQRASAAAPTLSA